MGCPLCLLSPPKSHSRKGDPNMDTIKRLADELPYRSFLKGYEGVVDERDDGIVKGYWLVGPPPDSCDADNLLARAEQLGRSPVHLRTGDAIQVVFDRLPA